MIYSERMAVRLGQFPLLTTDLLFAANKSRIPRWDLGRIQWSYNIPDLVKQ